MRRSHRRSLPAAVLVAVLAVVAAGCAREAAPVPDEAFGTWVLVDGEADGVPIRAAAMPIDLVVERDADGTRFGGRSACNSYFAGVAVEEGALVVGPVGSTMMACESPLMDLEALHLGALARVTAMTVDGDGLELTGPGVRLSFRAAG